MRKEQGFSLIELLIVVAIIAIIAAIAVPSMLQARMAANEAGAIQSCRTMGSAEVAYAAINNQSYTELATLVSGGFLDDRFSGGSLNGYTFGAGADHSLPDVFAFEGQPDSSKGRYAYTISTDQVVRYGGIGTNAPADTEEMMCGSASCTEGDPIGKTGSGS
jgi:prepilin-type N-terminal cleavage/methylation domain-containing protein